RLMTDSQPGIRPQLTVVIASPTVGAAFVRQTTAVPLADDQRCEVQPAGNGYRTLATRELRMLCLTGVLRRRAELSAAIESPAVCGAVGRERTGVVDAGADRRELDRRTRRSVGSDGRNATGPGEEDEGRLQRDHVRTPVEDGGHPSKADTLRSPPPSGNRMLPAVLLLPHRARRSRRRRPN